MAGLAGAAMVDDHAIAPVDQEAIDGVRPGPAVRACIPRRTPAVDEMLAIAVANLDLDPAAMLRPGKGGIGR